MRKSPGGTAVRTAPDFLKGGGAMAEAVLAKDWSATPLGPIHTWPQSLRTTVSLCLASTFPISMAWGPRRVQIYNDGYWRICKAKHPQSMGQDFKECWNSAWPQIGEAFEGAQAGNTSFIENERMFLDRDGYLEETFFTFSFSPIRDESGGVGGLFHPVTETTARMLSERRTRALRDLTTLAGMARTVDESCNAAAEVLEQYAFDLPFFLLYIVDDAGKSARLAASVGVVREPQISPAEINLKSETDDAVWPIRRVAESGKAELLTDLSQHFGPQPCGPYPELPRAAFVFPIARPGLDLCGAVLVAGVSSRLPLDDAYRGFYDLLVNHLGTALASVRAREEEHRKAAALAELDRAKTAFFSNVSHEFRTPLTLILGPLEELLAQQSVDPRSLQRELPLIHRNATRLLKLVNTLLDFSRIEAGRVEVVFQATDLARLTIDLTSAFRSAMERAGLRLVVDCSPLAEPIYVDREMWEKIVLNLISNALKFTFVGEIAVTLRPAGEFVALAVRDTGIGIEENELPRVFDRFHRILGARARTHEGTGIGLALVQELAHLHQGSISVASKFGEGTTFTVTIPRDQRNAAAGGAVAKRQLEPTTVARRAFVDETLRWVLGGAPESATEAVGAVMPRTAEMGPAAASRVTGNKVSGRILLADDNADMREYVQSLLQGSYAVETVADGEAALARARDGGLDLVLTDVMMPRMDGFQLLRELRHDPRTKTLPVILLSARAGQESRVEGLDAGADDYLVKPFTARELLARVDAHLRLAKLRRDAAALQESEALFRSMADCAPVLMWTCDVQRNCDYLNAGWIEFTGRAAAEQYGRGWLASVHPDHQEFFLSAFEAGFSSDLPFQMESRLQRHDGSYRWVLVTGAPRQWRTAESLGYIVSCVDIDDRKRAEEEVLELNEQLERRVTQRTAQLAAINKDLESFTASVAHDLRSPIFAVDGYCVILQDKYNTQLPAEAQHYLQRVRDSARNMNQLVEDLLKLSRIECRELERRPTALNSLIQAAVSELAAIRANRDIEWLLADLPTVDCDPGLMKQVFVNLLGNAVKYTRERPRARIQVGLVDAGSDRAIFVRDNGAGFDMQHAGKLFGAFERLHSREQFEGTGIGLATVQRIITKHHGRIWAEAAEQKGATFYFTLGSEGSPVALEHASRLG